jgi:DNA (cytosine-5)-methyltransferase 1
LGYHLAGFDERLAVEWDANACETLRLNFPNLKIYEGDIAKLSVDEALSLSGLKIGDLDVFDGSPPCQGFSTAGKREFADNRNQLFREFVRLLKGLQPKVFVMENVSGMVKGKMKLIFAEIMKELKSCGYRVKARLLNAMYFGVPQSRERLIFIGVRQDLNCVTAEDIPQGARPDGQNPPLIAARFPIEPSYPRPTSMPITAGQALFDVRNDPQELEMLLEAGKNKSSYNCWHLIKPGQSFSNIREDKNFFSAVKVNPDKPCPTVAKSNGNIGLSGLMHWAQRRRFTVAEFKRFCSFPDDYKFAGEWSDAVQRLGNAVMPLFMKAIAENIKQNILERIQ